MPSSPPAPVCTVSHRSHECSRASDALDAVIAPAHAAGSTPRRDKGDRELLVRWWGEFGVEVLDLANPTSNKIYVSIGYRRICKSLQYAFVSSAPASARRAAAGVLASTCPQRPVQCTR